MAPKQELEISMGDLRKLVLIGGAGTSRDVLSLINAINQETERYQVIGLLDDALPNGSSPFGVPVLGGLADGTQYTDAWFVDCLGSPNNYSNREKLLEGKGFQACRFETLVHPSVIAANDVRIGRGSILFPGVVVLSNVIIGQHVTILAGSILNHDVEIDDWSIIASGVILSGAVRVGNASYVGAGSVVRENLSIGDGSLVGLGSVVTKDIKTNVVVAGVPAKEMQRHL